MTTNYNGHKITFNKDNRHVVDGIEAVTFGNIIDAMNYIDRLVKSN